MGILLSVLVQDGGRTSPPVAEAAGHARRGANPGAYYFRINIAVRRMGKLLKINAKTTR
tara:strand:+ start:44 stop:220 length:177 start_codon:yes stop_codon:yes gene_type:complete